MALLMAFNGEKPSPNGATCKEVRSPGRTKERQQRWREEDSAVSVIPIYRDRNGDFVALARACNAL